MIATHRRYTSLTFLSLAACGGAPFTTAEMMVAGEDGGSLTPPLNTSGSVVDPPPTMEAAAPMPSATATAGSGSMVDPPPTMEAGVTPSPTSGSMMAASGSMMAASGSTSPTSGSGSSVSGSSPTSGSMSAGSGGSSGSVTAMSGASPTCTGATSQACGNCNTGTQTRTCTNGVWSAWGNCDNATIPTLTGVGAGNFTISFDLTDKNTSTQEAVLNQRADCLGTASAHSSWDIRLNTPMCGGSSLQVDTYNPISGLVSHCTLGSISGHHLELHRVSGTLSFLVDGVGIQSDTWSDLTNLAGLAPLATGTDLCPGASPLSGTLSNLCVEKQ